MKGDSIVVESHHIKAAAEILPLILPILEQASGRVTLSVAGQSGSGKSETATAIARALEPHGVDSVIFHQDDYFVHPPKTNDRTRRADISWVGTGEVRLDLMDQHLGAFIAGEKQLEKPLVIYADDAITTETLDFGAARVAIADGTYTSVLQNVMYKIFIERSYQDTRAHREKRSRDVSELDPFIDRVLEIEHEIISRHRQYADIAISKNYSVTVASNRLPV